jgi:hypothetical protein
MIMMKDIENVIDNIEIEAKELNNNPFTEQGFTEYRRQISEFIFQLYEESLRISERDKSDVISGSYVVEAVSNLRKKNKSKYIKIINTIGGLLIGTTFTNIVSMLVKQNQTSSLEIIITVSSGIIGAFLLGFYLFKE